MTYRPDKGKIYVSKTAFGVLKEIFMKKFLSLFMALAVALSVTACSSKDETANSGKADGETVQRSQTFQRSIYDPSFNTFVNSYTGITMTAPGDWYVCSNEEMAAVILEGNVSGDELGMWSSEDFEQQPLIPDFVVMDLATNNRVFIVYKNLSLSEDYQADITEEEYIEYLKADLEAQDGAYSFEEVYTVTLGNETFVTLAAETDNNGVVTKRYTSVKRFGDYMMIVASEGQADKSPKMYEMFFE